MAKREKPLNVLIITGAGASANLGVDDEALPMMAGWAADLIPRLGNAAPWLGLTSGTDGPAFEAIIGRFLNFSNSLSTVAALGFMGDEANLVGLGPRSPSGGNFANWHVTAEDNVAAMNRKLWESLWENFGRNRIDSEVADRAYGALHSLIRDSADDGQPCYIAHATTNFDTAIEVAIEESEDMEVRGGFARTSGGARERWAPNLLTVDRLGSDARIPVVHLHGAVGWYYDPNDNNIILRRPSDDRFDERMTPALLLPDDTKRPDLFPSPLVEVWDQFKALMRDATHVVVIGHSLHDEHLAKAINEAEKPTAVMSLGGLSLQKNPPSRWILKDPEEDGRIKAKIPEAMVFPGNFGSAAKRKENGAAAQFLNRLMPDFDTNAFTKWLDRN